MSHSDVSFIEVKDPTKPSVLFHEWIQEAKKFGGKISLMNLATASKNGKVSNRTVVIREIMPDASLAFAAQAYSNKIKDINENPQVAATILIPYVKNGKNVIKQIRLSGTAEKLSQEQCRAYFEKESLSSKIRAWVCQKCGPVDWKDLKSEHDQLLKEVVENKKVIEMPETQVAHKIVPYEFDFYFSEGEAIADRVLFKLVGAKWDCQRIMT
ncbi:pyridoxine/pyridoxamine 5'-phosphate oxidase isoform X2 [Tribolium castaneum]|uniref:pyridoxal 5'-phosphate synthase n=2 Tax=Tribolium castaneum TaxID=7070 RepID=D6X205_TRICA|nr:PREDICTED: pyridoxine/pyridoxamine 5'-phosphate oxidase isoform X2 [Tribolium castaneum]XP_015838748.1 PREDICTED: pyridoxine/pyridoxamine 5'-phosphate oxidase isoform X2 [Tribolium castaneum]EFA10196.1 Pyridoxine/pyridoxamine 5'-phosphate oxidase-like Protein [Tribolium castaneum]|eukprot:XP_015838747.1 PREDICTED: pyridoxine/pyridoxamine 5'-phosphate oxidase isoform X2 [Tribolium castaneum]